MDQKETSPTRQQGPSAVERLRWSVVLPVKRTDQAKTRLLGVTPTQRQELALAMALDTVTAALGAPSVTTALVVTDDEVVVRHLTEIGAHTAPDTPDAGLNPALRHGMAIVARRQPQAGIAALSADLPALRPADLERVLSAAAAQPVSFVADVSGVGTTMYLVRPDVQPDPCFGERSRAAHRSAGATEITDAARSTRRDVDTWVDLWDARRLGVGERTTAALRRVGLR